MERFIALGSLRGLCALALIVHHSRIEYSISQWPFFRNASQFAGFFFALSGFLLYRRYIDSLATPRQLGEFVTIRFMRVLPLHIVVLLFFVALEALKWVLAQRGLTLNQPAFSGDRALTEILPNLLLIQAWWPGANALSFNYPAWFVSAGLYLWILFGLLIHLVPAQARKVFSVLCALAFLMLYKDLPLLTREVWWAMFCFFSGTITYRIYVRLRDSVPGPVLASFMEIGILVLLYGIMTEGQQPLTLELSLLFCIAILIFAQEAGIVSQMLSLRWFPALGRLWLSIYMIHAGVIVVVTTGMTLIARSTGYPFLLETRDASHAGAVQYLSTGSAFNDNLLMLMIVIAVVVISMWTYCWIERPGMELGKRWGQGTGRRRRREDAQPERM